MIYKGLKEHKHYKSEIIQNLKLDKGMVDEVLGQYEIGRGHHMKIDCYVMNTKNECWDKTHEHLLKRNEKLRIYSQIQS